MGKNHDGPHALHGQIEVSTPIHPIWPGQVAHSPVVSVLNPLTEEVYMGRGTGRANAKVIKSEMEGSGPEVSK
jgi:hypothetical protein